MVGLEEMGMNLQGPPHTSGRAEFLPTRRGLPLLRRTLLVIQSKIPSGELRRSFERPLEFFT